jgi:hypothetical protein
MNKFRLLITATFLFSLSSISVAQIQPTVDTGRGYLRSTIITLPSSEGRPLLQYLDAGRVAADQGMQLFAGGKVDALYDSMSVDFKHQYNLEQFRQLSQVFARSAGQITSYEYRNQALEYPIDKTPISELAKAKTVVWYAMKTTKLSGDGIFMRVKTVREGSKHTVSFIDYVNYGEHMPPWLIHPDAPAVRN